MDGHDLYGLGAAVHRFGQIVLAVRHHLQPFQELSQASPSL